MATIKSASTIALGVLAGEAHDYAFSTHKNRMTHKSWKEDRKVYKIWGTQDVDFLGSEARDHQLSTVFSMPLVSPTATIIELFPLSWAKDSALPHPTPILLQLSWASRELLLKIKSPVELTLSWQENSHNEFFPIYSFSISSSIFLAPPPPAPLDQLYWGWHCFVQVV